MTGPVTNAIRAMRTPADPFRPAVERLLAQEPQAAHPDADLLAIGARLDIAVAAYMAFLPTYEAAQASVTADLAAAEADPTSAVGKGRGNAEQEAAYMAVFAPYQADMDRGDELTSDCDRLSEDAIRHRPGTIDGAAVIACAVRFWNLDAFQTNPAKRDWSDQLIVALVEAVLGLAGQDAGGQA